MPKPTFSNSSQLADILLRPVSHSGLLGMCVSNVHDLVLLSARRHMRSTQLSCDAAPVAIILSSREHSQ